MVAKTLVQRLARVEHLQLINLPSYFGSTFSRVSHSGKKFEFSSVNPCSHLNRYISKVSSFSEFSSNIYYSPIDMQILLYIHNICSQRRFDMPLQPHILPQIPERQGPFHSFPASCPSTTQQGTQHTTKGNRFHGYYKEKCHHQLYFNICSIYKIFCKTIIFPNETISNFCICPGFSNNECYT